MPWSAPGLTIFPLLTAQVKDDSTAVALDDVFNEMLNDVSEAEGVFGATRLVCKTEVLWAVCSRPRRM